MTEAARVTIPVSTNAGKAVTDLDKLDKSLGKNAKTASTADKAFGALKGALVGAGIIGAYRALSSALAENNKLFAVQEKAERKLEAIVRATGQAAGFSAKEMKKQAAALQDVTTFGDEVIMEGQAIIATFKGIQDEAFERTTEMALNLSAAFGQDLKSSAIQLGKALEDPATGLTALKRIGVSFTEEQKNQIKALQEAGEVAKAQGIILDVLEGQVGGVARAFALSASGAIEQWNNEVGDTQEMLGEITTTIQASFIPGMRQVNQTVQSELVPALTRLSDAFMGTSEDSSVVAESMSGIVKTFAQVLDAISLLVNGFKFLSAGIRKTIAENIESGAASSVVKAEKAIITAYGNIQNAVNAGAKGDKRALALTNAYGSALKKQADAQADFAGASKDGIKALNGIAGAIGAEKDKILENIDAQKKAREEREKAQKTAKQLEEQYKKLAAGLSLLAGAGNVQAAIKEQTLAFREQIQTVKAAGLETAALEQFQGKQRLELIRNILKQSVQAEGASVSERQQLLNQKYQEILNTENLSYQQRAAAQEAFNEQSRVLEQTRMQDIAATVGTIGGLASQVIGLGEAVSQYRQAQISNEISAMEARGATDEEIAAKNRELQRKAAKDQKTFGIFSTIIDTAVGVTKAFATLPLWAAIPAAALIAAKGAVQTAAIAATPLPAAQFGGSFVVPPGNAADSGLMRVNQGERVDVTPVRETDSGPQSQTLNIDGNEFRAYLTDEINRAVNSGNVQARRKGFIKTA